MLELDEHQTYPQAAFFSSRDSYVASTAVKIENLQTVVARLEREAEEMRGLLADLAETVEQNHRFYTFQQNEKRLKELRIDDLLRCCRDIKTRVDRIEGTDRPVVDFGQTTFEAVNKRISELARNQTRIEEAALVLRRNALVLLGGVFAAFVGLCFQVF